MELGSWESLEFGSGKMESGKSECGNWNDKKG